MENFIKKGENMKKYYQKLFIVFGIVLSLTGSLTLAKVKNKGSERFTVVPTINEINFTGEFIKFLITEIPRIKKVIDFLFFS